MRIGAIVMANSGKFPNKLQPYSTQKPPALTGGFILKNLLKHWRDGFANHLNVAPVLVVDLE